MDWEEELKRQAAISALLAPPEAENTGTPELDTITDEQVVAPASPDLSIPKHVEEHYGDWKKWDTVSDQQVVAPDTVYPTIAQDQPAALAPPRLNTVTDQQVVAPAPDKLTQVEKGELVKAPDMGERGAPIAPRPQIVDTPVDSRGIPLDEKPVPQLLDKGEAPAQLTQVERGEEWREPWHPAVKPNVPGIIAGSDNAILNPAAGVTPPTPVDKYPAQIVTPDEAAGKTSVVNAPAAAAVAPSTPAVNAPAAAVTPSKVTGGEGFFGGDLSQGPPGTKPDGTEDEPYWPKSDKDVALLPPGVNYIDPKDQSQKVTPGTPAPADRASVAMLRDQPKAAPLAVGQPAAKPVLDDWNTWLTPDGTPAGPAKAAKPSTWEIPANPNGSDLPQRVQAVGEQDPAAFIVHHTSGRGTVDGVVQTLKDRGLGVEYVMDRDGNIYRTGDAGAQNIKTGWGPKGTGLNNQNVVGMEIIAKDDKDVTPAQAQAFARFIAARYPNTPLFGHGEVNPGHKEADEGLTAKNAALAYREGGAGDGSQTQDTLAQLRSSGLNVTTFGQKDDPYGDPDSRAGRGKYVEQMIPGYDVALNAAAAAAVGNPKPGEEFRVGGRTFRYGDQVPELYKDARFDVFDPYNTTLATLGKEKAATEEPKKQDWESWATLSPEDQAKADTQAQAKAQATQQAETAAVYKLPEAQNSNIIGLYNRLATSVDGVSDQTRSQIQAKLKPEIIAQMRAKFPEIKTDDEAWAKAQSPVNPLDVGQEWGSKAMGFVQQFTEPMKKGAADTDKFSVDQFLNKVMPNASDVDKHDYLARLYGMPLDQRTAEIEARLGPGFVQPGNPYRDPYFLAQALDRLSDPNFQKRQADDVAKFQEEMKRNISSDPRLVDTGMDRIVNDTAQIPAAVAAFSNPALWPMALAQVHGQVMDGFKKEHPEWDAKTLQERSTYATLTQFFGGLVAGHVMSAGAGALMEGIEGKAQRAIAQAVFGGTTNALIGGTTQLGTNLIAGDPPSKNVGEATLSGLIQGTGTGIIHGVGELAAPRPEAKVAPTQGEVQPPPLPETKLSEPVATPTHDEIVASALEAAQSREAGATATEILGAHPDHPEEVQGDVLNAVAKNLFPDLTKEQARNIADRASLLSVNNLETNRFRYELEKFLPQTEVHNFGPTERLLQAYLAFKNGPTELTAKEISAAERSYNEARKYQPPAAVSPGFSQTPEETAAQASTPRAVSPPQTLADAIAQAKVDAARARAEASLGGTPRVIGVDERGNTRTVQKGRSSARVTVREMLNAGGDSAVVAQKALDAGHGLDDPMPKPGEPAPPGGATFPTPAHRAVYNDLVARGMDEGLARDLVSKAQGATPADILTDVQTRMREGPPPRVGESEPYTSKVANRYTAERMAAGELGQIDPAQGKSTEELVRQGIQMSPEQRERLINNLVKGTGGDLDTQGAAIRSKEAILSVQSHEAGRAAEADPNNRQLKADADAALKAVTDFHNGPMKKFKRVWSDAGRGLQREIPLDYTTLNGMKEAYVKGKGNGKEAPPELEPKLKQTAERVRKVASDEQAAISEWGKDVEKQTRGKALPSDESIRARLMELMKDLPCRN